MISRLVLVLFSILLSPGGVADDMSHRQAAEELLTASNTDGIVNAMYRQLYDAFVETTREMHVPADKQPVIEKYVQRLNRLMLDEFWEEMKKQLVDIYIRVFTENEMRELTAFYKSPTGQKYLEKTPELMRQSTMISRAQMKEIMPKIQGLAREMAAELKTGD